EVRGKGLMLIALLPDDQFTTQIVDECRNRGVIFFLLLYEKRAIRITPPYAITDSEIEFACTILKEVTEIYYPNSPKIACL
ncbi:MAG: acetylornithine/N-succinyldiaminopimelate aminotransferase, partial [Psychromonas sp.]